MTAMISATKSPILRMAIPADKEGTRQNKLRYNARSAAFVRPVTGLSC